MGRFLSIMLLMAMLISTLPCGITAAEAKTDETETVTETPKRVHHVIPSGAVSEYGYLDSVTVDENGNRVERISASFPASYNGEYKTAAQIKRAEGARAFTAKGVLNGVDRYTIQYRDNGRATIAVCYEDGYMKVFYVDIAQKVPTMVQNDNVVTFGNLDDLKVVRYAKGEYTTSAQIKAAPGSVALKPEKVVNGLLTVELKSAGTYTFCVQYNDESYNYYTVVVD